MRSVSHALARSCPPLPDTAETVTLDHDIRRLTVVAHRVGDFGGMESQLARLVNELLDGGVEVRVIAGRCTLKARQGLSFIPVRGPQRPFPIAYPWFVVKASWKVRRRSFGPVYTIGAITLNRAEVRKVPFCHLAWARSENRDSRASKDNPAFRLNAAVSGFISRSFERIIYRPSRSGTLVAMSHGDASELDSLFPNLAPARVIPNGVDTARFRPDRESAERVRAELGIDERALLAAFVGGDWRRKGLPVAIEALSISGAWQLVVVGGGDKDAMAKLAKEFGVERRVHFVGRTSEPESYLAAADALVMPSAYEPFGNAVLEASARGIPVVVAPAAGVNDFVENGVTGLVVPRDPRQVANALDRLRDRDLRSRMGAAGRELAHGYRYESVADRYARLLALNFRQPAPMPTEPARVSAQR